MLNPHLDERLTAVLNFIQAQTHADIGSDHAHLPIQIIRNGRARKCLIVELNPGPLRHARQNVAAARMNTQIEVRQGDGFTPLQPGEVQSASLTGMGASTMLGILERAQKKLPATLILQPNDSPRSLRQWAYQSGWHLSAETMVSGFWTYPVLKLSAGSAGTVDQADQGDQAGQGGAVPDPIYDGLPLQAAWRYGPHLLRESGTLLRRQVWNDVVRLTPLAAPGRPAEQELMEAQMALKYLVERQPIGAGL